MNSVQYPELRRNWLAFGLDFVFFGIAMAFISPTTVLPSLATGLGASKTLIGLLVTLYYLAWDLPQLVAGNIIRLHANKKPVLLKATYLGRPMILGYAFLLLLTDAKPPWLSLAGLFAVIIVMFSSDAFAAIAWFDLLGRAFPPERRGGYLAIWQLIKGVGVLGVAALVRIVLGPAGIPFPRNYALLFGAAGIALIISVVGLAAIHEPPPDVDQAEVPHIAWRDLGKHLGILWRQDMRLRRATVARILLAMSTMASPFYVLFATEELGFLNRAIAFFISAQTIGSLGGSLLLGHIADRHGSGRVIQMGTVLVLSAPVLALIIALTESGVSGPLRTVYLWIYISLGIAENVGILGFLNYVLDATPPAERTMYMGVTNTVSSVGVLGPVIAGWLLTLTSYPALFAVAALSGIGALWLAFGLPPSRSKPPVITDI